MDFIEKYGLKPRDAFHLAIMENFNIKEIVSDDSDFDKIKGIKRIKL
ncbi:MAG: type II toxin-antitoxin system VapC family toxin [Nanoarchaeota archaeon]